jgi:hypothetical protein
VLTIKNRKVAEANETGSSQQPLASPIVLSQEKCDFFYLLLLQPLLHSFAPFATVLFHQQSPQFGTHNKASGKPLSLLIVLSHAQISGDVFEICV